MIENKKYLVFAYANDIINDCSHKIKCKSVILYVLYYGNMSNNNIYYYKGEFIDRNSYAIEYMSGYHNKCILIRCTYVKKIHYDISI